MNCRKLLIFLAGVSGTIEGICRVELKLRHASQTYCISTFRIDLGCLKLSAHAVICGVGSDQFIESGKRRFGYWPHRPHPLVFLAQLLGRTLNCKTHGYKPSEKTQGLPVGLSLSTSRVCFTKEFQAQFQQGISVLPPVNERCGIIHGAPKWYNTCTLEIDNVRQNVGSEYEYRTFPAGRSSWNKVGRSTAEGMLCRYLSSSMVARSVFNQATWYA